MRGIGKHLKRNHVVNSMETDPQKALLIARITEWIEVEDNIIEMRARLRGLTAQRKSASDWLLKTMKDNGIDEFKLSDRVLAKKTKRSRGQITKKHLVACLDKIYSERPDMAATVVSSIMDTRQERVYEQLRLK